MKKLFATCIFVFAGLLMYMYSYAETVSISGAVTQFSSSSGLALNDITIDVTGTKIGKRRYVYIKNFKAGICIHT